MTIRVEHVTKRFGGFVALGGVSLEIGKGELVALVGPSGSGKTTLLRLIAGLETPDTGTVILDGVDASRVASQERGIGLVFQHYALFKHMTVFENIAFGLRVRKEPKKAVEGRVRELLALIRLEGLADRMPSQLSGGQRQRVALARALATRPKVLLLDEPFGALDAKVRRELRTWLRGLHADIGVTTVLVTHDQEEAFGVADRVVVMNGGHIVQDGLPSAVYENPANRFVMELLGHANVLHGSASRGRASFDGFEVDFPDHPGGEQRPAVGYVRPHELEVSSHAVSARAPESIPGTVARILPLGAAVRVEVSAPQGLLVADVESARFASLALTAGAPVSMRPRRVRVFLDDPPPRA